MPTYRHSYKAMGSSFHIWIDADMDEHTASGLMATLQNRTEQLEQVMSRFRADSELVSLNGRTMQPVEVSATLLEVLQLAQMFVELSAGGFDPRILPGLERIGYKGAFRPECSALEPSVLSDTVLEPTHPLFEIVEGHRTLKLHRPVDLGGIGKGYTADQLAALIEVSVEPSKRFGYFVDAGGDIVISGHQEDGEGWSIGVEDPYGTPEELAAVVSLPPSLEHIAICTSSLKRRSWEYEGRRVHHLLDPEDGTPVETKYRAVTAVGPAASYTEVFTKCKMIQERRGGQGPYPWAGHQLPYVAIDVHHQLTYSAELQPVLIWISEKYRDGKA